jgi:hypothetical protein
MQDELVFAAWQNLAFPQSLPDHDLQQHIVSGLALACHSYWGILISYWMAASRLEEMQDEPVFAE